MDEFYIKKITEEVFEKARKKSASHKKYALAKEVEAATGLSYRTVERAYDKYIKQRVEGNKPTANTIEEFCTYLGYSDYAEFVEQNKLQKLVNQLPQISQEGKNEIDGPSVITRTKSKKKKWRYGSVITAFALTLIIALYVIAQNRTPELKESKCMTWTGNAYEEISCSEKPYSKYGTSIEPYDQKRIKNFKRVEVDMATTFFAEKTDKPLIWYYKTEGGTIEYYTAPGLHPLNGKTLKAITEYIIMKYVPIHQNKKSSFLLK